MIDGEEVGARIVGSQWLEEFLWQVQLSNGRATWDRVELELVLFLQISFDSLLGVEGGIPPSLEAI